MGAMSENLKSGGFQNVHDVGGVGDEAFWGSRSAMGKTMGELSVRKGKSILIEIVISGFEDEAAALDRAKALAAKALPRA